MRIVMKITSHLGPRLNNTLLASVFTGTILSVSSCAPDPELQEQMERDILSASEVRKAGDSAGPQQGRGSQAYGHGGF